jgi:hypothetical protein
MTFRRGMGAVLAVGDRQRDCEQLNFIAEA